MSDKLLPCPYCGNKDIDDPVILRDEWSVAEEKRYTWRISCGKCSCLIEGYGENPNHLIDHWNSSMRDE